MVVKVQAPRAGDGADAGQRALFRKRPTAATTHVRVNETHVSSLSLRQSVLVCGDACRALRLLPDGCVQTVVTSPPYWSLRDYAVEAQIGRDDTLVAYIDSIVTPLKRSGVCSVTTALFGSMWETRSRRGTGATALQIARTARAR